jgi:RimJ/RimL family protein N-acetyltransferase
MVSLRPAAAADEGLLLAWANDPVVRAAGFQPEPISADTHHRWFMQRLAEPASSRIWIGLEDDTPIGVVRVDMAPDGTLVVSISLDPAQRGLGKSRPLLEAGLSAARAAFPRARFRAWIRHDNSASVALFEGAGFEAPPNPPTDPAGTAPNSVVLERD